MMRNMMKTERFLYVDNLRLTMTVLVVMIHLAVTYSGIGGWYYYDVKELNTLSTLFFLYFESFTQSYFMGFLFLIAGYFAAHAYNRKGFSRFVKGRLFRLGIPTLFYMLIISPLTMGITMNHPNLEDYLNYLRTFQFIEGSGPLWFALALLIFCIIYAVVRVIKEGSNKDKPKGVIKQIA